MSTPENQTQTNESQTDETGLPIQDELASLKARADLMGVTYHPSIGLEKLREKVTAALSGTPGDEDKDPESTVEAAVVAVEESLHARRNRKRREANELIRVRVTCMNPAKKEWEGEMFTGGNSVVGSFTKFVPFNVADGWHIPRIIYNIMKERQCQIFKTVKDARGNNVRKGMLIKEFGIELLDNLTPNELKELAQRQAMANSID